jgi:hypothetical protein
MIINKQGNNIYNIDNIEICIYGSGLTDKQRTLLTTDQIKALERFIFMSKKLKIKSTVCNSY